LLQLVFNKPENETLDTHAPGEIRSLDQLAEGEEGVLEQLDLPEDAAQRLMALGFVPGCCVQAGRSVPGGDPRVYRVDGAEIALRAETAARLRVRSSSRGHESSP
jgi:ferrous iron transport protein A